MQSCWFALSAMSSPSLQTIKSYHHQAQHLVNSYLLADPFIPYTSVLTGIFLCKVVLYFPLFLYIGQSLDPLCDSSSLGRSMIFVTLSATPIPRPISSSPKFRESNGTTGLSFLLIHILYSFNLLFVDVVSLYFGSGISTVHALFISALSLYFVFCSDLFSDRWHNDLVVFRSSRLSSLGLGVNIIFQLIFTLWDKNVLTYIYDLQLSIGYFIADLGMIFWKYPALGGLEYVSTLFSTKTLYYECIKLR